MRKGQGIVEYAVILAIVMGLVVIFLGNVRGTLERYQRSAVNTMAGG
jgi:Flp pilus assembly pilin Flp